MAGWNLRRGELIQNICNENEYWECFNYFFINSKKRNSYKFGFIKSILDNVFNIEKRDGKLFISYEDLFTKFTENYWNLVLKYHLKQMRKDGKSETSKIEFILTSASKNNNIINGLEFDSLDSETKVKIVKEVEKQCKTNVIGATYEDFQGKLFAFDLDKKEIELSNGAYNFILKFKPEIEKLNYYAWAKFLETINDDDVIVRLIDKLELSTPRRNDLSIYRDILHMEFEENTCFYCGKKLQKINVDHFIPWSFVKDDKLWNLVLSCPECNTKKNNLLVKRIYIDKLEERNKKIINSNNKNTIEDFKSYSENIIEEMWEYAKKSGYKEIL